MNRIAWLTVPVLAVSTACVVFPSFAQPQPQYVLTLKGAAFGRVPSVTATDIQVIGNVAYVTWSDSVITNDPGGLEILDVSDVTFPVPAGEYRSTNQVNALRVLGHYAYLASGTLRTHTNDPGLLEIIDIRNPARPVRVGFVDTPGRVTDIDVVGTLAFLTESTRWTGSNLLGALEIYDVGDPESPIHLATYDTPAGARSVAVSGNYAYLADGVTDLAIIDVANPASPTRVGVYDIDEAAIYGPEAGGPASHIGLSGGRVYSAGENGLYVLDVSVPSNPTLLAGSGYFPFLYAFHVSPARLYFAYFFSLYNQFFISVSDVRQPEPIPLARDPLATWPVAIDEVDRYVFVAGRDLLIYELVDVPAIHIARCANALVLTWPTTSGFRLQRTNEPLEFNLWTDVPDSESVTRVELPLTQTNQFFRLVRPY